MHHFHSSATLLYSSLHLDHIQEASASGEQPLSDGDLGVILGWFCSAAIDTQTVQHDLPVARGVVVLHERD